MNEQIVVTRPFVVPTLSAVTTLETDLDLAEVAARCGPALGVTFAEDTWSDDGTDGLVAIALGHTFVLYVEESHVPEAPLRTIVLNLHRQTSLNWLGLDLDQCQDVFLYIGDFVTALLRKETGLPFVAEPHAR
jgi:hypothetical protein